MGKDFDQDKWEKGVREVAGGCKAALFHCSIAPTWGRSGDSLQGMAGSKGENIGGFTHAWMHGVCRFSTSR